MSMRYFTWIVCLAVLMGSAMALAEHGEGDGAMVPAPEGYLSPGDVPARLNELGQRDGVRILQIATTPEGQEVLMVAFAEKDTPGRPAVLIVADPDGDRPGATQLAVTLCEHFAAGDSPLTEAATVYVLPVANPDAAKHAFAGGDAWRGAPVDEDRDGLVDEDPPEDLNGDGFVLQMRVADPTGGWLIDEKDHRFVRRAEHDEGEFGGWRLLREGVDSDSDRLINEDAQGDVKLECNWPHRWREHDTPSGRFQLSEPETQGLADFMLERPNIALVVVLGSEDNLSKPPEGIDRVDSGSTEPVKQDAALIKVLADRLLKDVKQKPRSSKHGSGNFADWAYFHFGALVLESAVWSPPLDPEAEKEGKKDEDSKKKDKAPEEVKLLQWNDKVLGGAGFVPWTPFEHPELGQVEIGGWKPFVLDNPPASELESLAQSWIAFLDSLSQDLPRLSWEKAEVRDLGGNTFDARINLVSKGLFPTTIRMGERARRQLRLRIVLELPEDGQLLIGRPMHSVSRLRGLGDHREFRWVYQLPAGADPARVRVTSQAAGEAEAVLEVSK